MAKVTEKFFCLDWLKKHPNHFKNNPHAKQIAARDKHLLRTKNKDGYDK